MEDLKLRRRYEVNEPMCHIITGKLEVYDTLLDLLKEGAMINEKIGNNIKKWRKLKKTNSIRIR